MNTSSTPSPLTISALTTHVVSLFERDELLRDVWVLGEVSNWKRAASGHAYFSLKDRGATINAVMWRGSAARQSWLPQSGDQVLAHGYVGVYPERGVYQFYANRLQPAGRGQLYARFEALKAQLAEQGLFDSERKRPLPPTPQRIGIITSADAAALRDVLRVLTVRWPLLDVVLFPCLVQGADAPSQIVAALQTANQFSAQQEPLDLLILTRGGGSIEDLWSFNDEGVARAVAESALPVVAGVGHETDFTIVDFVADLRVPTPSAAAATITPDRSDVQGELLAMRDQLTRHAAARVEMQRRMLGHNNTRLERLHPQRQLDLRRQQLNDREQALHSSIGRLLQRLDDRNHSSHQRLEALSPHAVLRRGYSIVQKEDGHVVTKPADVAADEPLNVHAMGGSYRVRAVQ